MNIRHHRSPVNRLAVGLASSVLLLLFTTPAANAQEGNPDRPMVVGIVPGPVAAVDMYLKIEGIEGESKDKAHSGWIDVLAVSWGAVQATPVRAARAAPRRGAERKRPGRVKYGDITLKKGYDAWSSSLAEACATGKHIPSVVVEYTTSEADGSRYMRVELRDVVISSYSIDASGDRPVESISLNYAEVKTSYIPQDQRGKVETEWKVEEGER